MLEYKLLGQLAGLVGILKWRGKNSLPERVINDIIIIYLFFLLLVTEVGDP